MIEKLAKYRVKIIISIFILSFFLIIGGFSWAYFSLRNISQPLIIHFSDYTGINQKGSLRDLAFIAGISSLAVLVNFFLTIELEKKDRFLGKLVTVTTLLFGLLIFIGFRVIISVN